MWRERGFSPSLTILEPVITGSIAGGAKTVRTADAAMHHVSDPAHSPLEPFWAAWDKHETLFGLASACTLTLLARMAPVASGRGRSHATLRHLQYLPFSCPSCYATGYCPRKQIGRRFRVVKKKFWWQGSTWSHRPLGKRPNFGSLSNLHSASHWLT